MSNESYFSDLQERLDTVWEIAENARSGSRDPEETVEIKRAEDMAERTEMFLGIDGLTEEIRSLQDQGMDRERMAFELTDKFLDGELGDFESEEDKIEAAIRTALAILTEAVVAAPLEGLIWVRTESKNPDDNEEYIRIKYGGPIRSAGGTGQVISVLIADYCRQEFGIGEYNATDDEIERYVEELSLYHHRHRNLQYFPDDDETRTIIKNTSIMLDAEPVTDDEVSGYRNLDRIDTNAGRGGMCLVVGEGIAQKVPKLQKYTDELGLDGWDWLSELPNASKVDKSEDGDEENTSDGESEEGTEDNNENSPESEDDKQMKHGRVKVKPKSKYIDDTLTAGRPIIGHPSRPGGFRLRYGRARNTGMAAGGISPITMVALYDYVGPGTQLKTERPGKAIATSPVDSLEGPTVKLEDGTVTRLQSESHARDVRGDIDTFLDLGEIGIPYGEFLENNAQLAPASYTHEWWAQEADEAGFNPEHIDPEQVSFEQAWKISKKFDIPLHPKYTYLWHDITLQEYVSLSNAVSRGESTPSGELIINDKAAPVAEKLLIPHKHEKSDGLLRFDSDHAELLRRCCDASAIEDADNIMEAVNNASEVTIRERAPTRIGTRMGRPEKAERRTFQRQLNVHGLYPVGEDHNRRVLEVAGESNETTGALDGGKTDKSKKQQEKEREESLDPGAVEVDLATRVCPHCQSETHKTRCPSCEERTKPYADCPRCRTRIVMDPEDMGQKDCPECGKENVTANEEQPLNINSELQQALDTLDERKSRFDSSDVIGVEGLVSQEKIPEPLEKLLLRAKHDIGIFKDGTSRFDATNLPLTSFKPEEAEVSVEKLRELGYTHDIHGNELTEPDQLVELKRQDVIIPQEGAEYMLRTANFVDELLQKYYDEDAYYNAESKDDLVGELIIGLAPHTSAGALGRIIGFTDAVAQYAHPFYYGAKRRNCDSDEDAFMLLLDGLLNYSEHYLNHNKSGKFMDEPVVMNSVVDPAEIDDEAHNVDIEGRYPLEFYEATLQGVGPKEVDIEIAEERLDDPTGFKHSLDTTSIDGGPKQTVYKTLPSMDEKIERQFTISEKVRATDVQSVAAKVIDGHFIADLRGNLRAFGQQDVQCTNCYTKYRRPPLDGECKVCSDGSLNLTVHEGSVVKYLDNMREMADSFPVDTYLEQLVEQYDRSIESLFKNDKNKQVGLDEFV